MTCVHTLLIVAAMALLTAGSSAAPSKGSCVQSSYGACFRVHGRFTVYTGDGQEVLWPIGTHRLLRVESGAEPMYKVLTGGDESNFVPYADDYSVRGDFVVCPLQRDIPGAMRSICIKHTDNLMRVKRTPSK